MSEAREIVVFGGRSYTAAELLRLMVFHSHLELGALVSRSAPGEALSTLHPHVADFYREHRACSEDEAFDYLKENPNAIIALCLGKGESAAIASRLEKRGLLSDRVMVDLSGDFRLKSAAEYQRWYGIEHPCPELLQRFDYVLPEIHGEKAESSLVSNPGCFASAVQLALWPALRADLVEKPLHVFAVTGSSGSGARATAGTHHPTRAHDFYAYKVLKHQHTPEICAGLGIELDDLRFTTHSSPLVRGIHVTAHLTLKDNASAASLSSAYAAFADAHPMIGFQNGPVRTALQIGTNKAQLGLEVDGRNAVAFCAIDNLTRGASGQAIQNLNRVCGFPQGMGLTQPGMLPL